jgi:hypothetical protein
MPSALQIARTKLEEAAALLEQLPYNDQVNGVKYLQDLLQATLERTRLQPRAQS